MKTKQERIEEAVECLTLAQWKAEATVLQMTESGKADDAAEVGKLHGLITTALTAARVAAMD